MDRFSFTKSAGVSRLFAVGLKAGGKWAWNDELTMNSEAMQL